MVLETALVNVLQNEVPEFGERLQRADGFWGIRVLGRNQLELNLSF